LSQHLLFVLLPKLLIVLWFSNAGHSVIVFTRIFFLSLHTCYYFYFIRSGHSTLLTTFTARVSYLPILQQVAQQCCLPYISRVHEILEDGTCLYGIEVELPALFSDVNSRRFFFGQTPVSNVQQPTRQLDCKALVTLQDLYSLCP
jgi:hypothetical protein